MPRQMKSEHKVKEMYVCMYVKRIYRGESA